jgi:uncharacterized protein YggE
MKKNIGIKLLLIVLLGAVLFSACTPVISNQEQANNMNIRTLSVSGSGQVTLVPDIARINIGVNSKADLVTTAVNKNNKQAQAITDALLKKGVDAKDIQTANFNVYPMNSYDNMGNVTGIEYSVDNTLYITVRDLKALSEILDAAIVAGANQIYGISFDIEDRAAAQVQARDLALKDAEAKANDIAKTVGVTLGEIVSINVSNMSYVEPYPMYGMGGGMAMDMAAEASVPVSAGQIVVTYDVSLVYRIK